MTQNDQAVFVIDFCVLRNAFPIKAELSFHAVMVALNQVLMSPQPLHNLNTVFFVFPERIAQNIDGIVICNSFIPVLNQRVIHLRGI